MLRSFPLLPALVWLLLGWHPASAQPDENCAATESNLAWWREIASNADEPRINADALAYDLLPCLGSENPELRDSIGYGLYTYWLRNDLLSIETKGFLTAQLSENLVSDESLLRSFSALILSELLRADALDAFMADNQRATLLRQAAEALLDEADFRGLDSELGWIHPVAHLGDVLWRMALHPALGSEQAELILASVGMKARTTVAAYQFNEGDRLARVIAILLQRDLIVEEQWLAWLEEFESRSNDEEWSTAFTSVEGMVELHNTKLFLRALDGQLAGAQYPAAVASKLQEILTMMNAMV